MAINDTADSVRTNANTSVSPSDWLGSAWQSESTFHQLSPYIGKTKSSMAASLVARFSKKGDTIYDPFAGCGTLAFEAWAAGRNIVATDLSPYANILTKAKLFPYRRIEEGQRDIERAAALAATAKAAVDLRTIPRWVREFFHPETLREIIAWNAVLTSQKRWFLLSCLLGILHHQRPGFLSFPSSHTVPYLRVKKFPQIEYPELYEYRPLRDRLEAKLERAFRRVPNLDFSVWRHSVSKSADAYRPPREVDTLISSPPYMRQLDYGRDNRLRLWFLGCFDWRGLDDSISPGQDEFLLLMEKCFRKWRKVIRRNGYCVLVVGNECNREGRQNLPFDVVQVAVEKVGGYSLVSQYSEAIPNDRRVRRGLVGSTSETILVLRNLGESTES